jgi:hypothetical protein
MNTNNSSVDQAATWVVRKETNGRLRWRLLPLHAALIFQAPHTVIDRLLDTYAAAAAAKDDQGMLPLHLAFRNVPLDWNVLEDLMTAHPAAVQRRDRKGRTPVQAGLTAPGSTTSSSSSTPTAATTTTTHTTTESLLHEQQHRAALSCLELYGSIVVAGEKNKWHREEGKLHVVAEQHAIKLTELRQAFLADQAARQAQHERELQVLRRELVGAEKQAKETKQPKNHLPQPNVSSFLSSALVVEETGTSAARDSGAATSSLHAQNQVLRTVVCQLWQQQQEQWQGMQDLAVTWRDRCTALQQASTEQMIQLEQTNRSRANLTMLVTRQLEPIMALVDLKEDEEATTTMTTPTIRTTTTTTASATTHMPEEKKTDEPPPRIISPEEMAARILKQQQRPQLVLP